MISLLTPKVIILRIAKIITVKATGIIALNDLAIPVGTLYGSLITSALNPSKNLINSTEIKAEINAVNIPAAPK